MTTTTTYYYRQNDDYSFDVEMDNGEVTRLHNAPNWLDGSELDYAASMLHNYTGLRVARVVSHKRFPYMGLHVWGSTSYSVLADDMSGQLTMTVLYLDGITLPVWRPLFQVEFDRWQELAQAAGAINLL